MQKVEVLKKYLKSVCHVTPLHGRLCPTCNFPVTSQDQSSQLANCCKILFPSVNWRLFKSAMNNCVDFMNIEILLQHQSHLDSISVKLSPISIVRVGH